MSLRKSIGKIFRFIFTTNSANWFELDLTKEIQNYKSELPIQINNSSNNETIEWLKKQNLSWTINNNEISTALKNNHSWPTAKINDEIIGSIKIGFNKIYITDFEKTVDFPEKTAFIYDTFVLKEHRNKGVASQLISESVKYAKNKGYLKIGCHIPDWNKPSIVAYERAGFEKILYIRYLRIFGISFMFKKSLKAPKKFKITKIGSPYEQN